MTVPEGLEQRIREAQERVAEKIAKQRRLIDMEQRQLDRLMWQERMLQEGLDYIFTDAKGKTVS